jgi:NitT/TauT family transport system permease protein
MFGRRWIALKNELLTELQKSYVKKIRKEKRFILLMQFIIFASFFALWELSSAMQWIDPLLFSKPSKIISLFFEKLAEGTMLTHVGVTLLETILGFLLGTSIGTILAAMLWSSKIFAKVSDPYLVILNAMPKVALGPILIVSFGPGYVSIIAMGAIISVIITTLVVYSAFNNVDDNYVKVMKTFGASKWQCFKEVILPNCFPTIISTLKVNVGLSWVGVIVGEFLVSQKGLGYLIIYGFQVFNFTLVLLSLIIIAVFATLMYKLVEVVEHKLIKNHSNS